MADSSSQEKTESATPRRIQQAREKGQIPRSKDLNTTVALMTAAVGMWIFGPLFASSTSDLMQRFFTLSRADAFDVGRAKGVFAEVVGQLALPVIGYLGLIFLMTIAASGLVGGFNFSGQAMAPKLSKMSPLKGLKRMFGIQAAVELGKSIGKFFVVAICAWLLLSFFFDRILNLSRQEIDVGVGDAVDLLRIIIFLLGSSLALIAAVDVPYQIWKHAKDLRMSLQEVKDEYKEIEGRPEIKGKIKQMQREMSQRRMMAEVPDADVVVTNPTHFAVALKYDGEAGGAPKLVAKGGDAMAMKIREVAAANDVPQISAPPLARAIYHTTELDQEIPEGLFMAVAQILAYVHQLKLYRSGKGKRPRDIPRDLDIPDDMQY